ncbi:MAG: phosphoribosylglycinamide formyltransferase [Chitinophagaceae bacterium]
MLLHGSGNAVYLCGMLQHTPRIVFMASGGGSNVEAIVHHLRSKHHTFESIILCNNPKAGIIERSRAWNIDVLLFDRARFQSPELLTWLQEYQPDLIVLAGFLWQIPATWVSAFSQKIINIHPALLPRFGGKGMYGHHIHEAVIAAGETHSGITIHYVNEHYDEGAIILQEITPIEPGTTPEVLAKQVLAIEHHWFPRVVEDLLWTK